MPIIDKYNARSDKLNSLLCVGLDSDFDKLPTKFKSVAEPQFEFNKEIITQTHEYAAAFKLNIAFYEARGEAGARELKKTMDYLRAEFPDIFLVCDCKRADIGNTNNGYVTELYDWYGFDAITLYPYFGAEALQPFLDRKDKGAIILCRSSNPGGGEIQDLKVGDKPLWQVIAEKVRDEWNKNDNCLLMIGATRPAEMALARQIMGEMTFLVPGLGVQGGEVEAAVKAGLNSIKKGMIINSSRGIIFAADPGEEARKLKEAINQFR